MTNTPDLLTWAALLAKWTDFARSAVALPKEGEGGRYREAVPAIIALQAVAFALADLESLPPDERALGADFAEVLVRRHASELHVIWHAVPLPDEVGSIVRDAMTTLSATREGGLEWTVSADRLTADHPAELVGALKTLAFEGDLFVPAPGADLFATCPAVFARDLAGATPRPEVRHLIEDFYSDLNPPHRIPGPRQAYRQLDFATGKFVRDLVVPMSDTLPGGQPLLVAAMHAGRALPVPLAPRRGAPIPELSVEFSPSPEPRTQAQGRG